MRTSAALAFVAVVAVVGCPSSKGRPTAAEAGGTPPEVSSGKTAAPAQPARFSRPIAAVAAPSGVTFVAGLVVPRGAIAVTALGPDGATRWTQNVIPGV